MQTRHQLAILAAGLLVGAQIGIAAIGQPIPDTEQQMEPVAPELQAEQESASTPEETQPELTAGAQAPEPAPAAAPEPAMPIAAPQPVYRWERTPPWGSDEPALLPSVIAYLERTEHLRVTGAPGRAFPQSTDDPTLLPATIAYFERLEATRLAAQAQPMARVENSPAVTANPVVDQSARTAPQDVAALDARSPSSTGTPF